MSKCWKCKKPVDFPIAWPQLMMKSQIFLLKFDFRVCHSGFSCYVYENLCLIKQKSPKNFRSEKVINKKLFNYVQTFRNFKWDIKFWFLKFWAKSDNFLLITFSRQSSTTDRLAIAKFEWVLCSAFVGLCVRLLSAHNIYCVIGY